MIRAEGATDSHSTVFFTFQFYKFPHITTERLLLGEPDQQLTADRSAQPCILTRLNPDGKVKDGPAGYQVGDFQRACYCTKLLSHYYPE